MNIDQKTTKAIMDFTKYAKFISDKFDVEVRFDGLNAATDGKVIYLPSIAGMTDVEIDFLYCILLHEVGHIKYTKEFFISEELKKVKTKNHLNMINSIEDARIENLLMKDFDGAKFWFDRLYNLYSSDNKFMTRIFGASKSNSSWFGLGLYVHNFFINLTVSDISGSLTKPAYREVQTFINDNNIDELLKNSDISTWDGIVDLSNTLYSLFYANKADKSELNDMADMMDLVDSSESMVNDLKEQSEQMIAQVKEIQARQKELKEKIDEFNHKKTESLFPLTKEHAQKKEALDQLRALQEMREEIKHKAEKLQSYGQKQNELLSKKEQYSNDLRELLENTEPKTEKEQTKIDSKKESLNRRMQSLDKKVDELNKKIQKQQDRQKDIDELKKSVNPSHEQLNDEQVKSEIERVASEVSTLRSQIDSLSYDRHPAQQTYDLNREQIKQLNQNLNKNALSAMRDMQKKMDEMGIPMDIIPSFKPDESWGDSNAVQQAFDERAMDESGSIVNNGVGFDVSGGRDVIALIEKAQNDLESLDLGKHFHKKNELSRLDSLNEISEFTNTEDQKDTLVGSSDRKHLASTTQFDAVKIENSSSGKEVEQIKTANRDVINKIKHLFRTKLKFTKKDRFKGNKEEGRLDSRNLYKLAAGMDTYFWEENQPKFINQVSASIVLDISGSMDKEISEYGRKLKELTVFFSEGLKECHIKHEIIGYHAPVSQEMRNMNSSRAVYNRRANRLETVVYKKFQDSNNRGIENLEIKCSDNSDGESLKIAYKRLAQERSKKKVMFIITDGKPFLSDSDTNTLDQDLKDVLKSLSKSNVEVYAFGFNDQPKEFYGDRYCKVTNYQDVINFITKKMG